MLYVNYISIKIFILKKQKIKLPKSSIKFIVVKLQNIKDMENIRKDKFFFKEQQDFLGKKRWIFFKNEGTLSLIDITEGTIWILRQPNIWGQKEIKRFIW